MVKDQLEKYCEEKEIFIPAGATLEYLNAAVVRAAKHMSSLSGKCFGFWDTEDPNCLTCSAETECFRAAHGMDKEKYFKAIERVENPKFRFTKILRKS